MTHYGTIKSIHYLRGVAALMVVFFHFRYYLNDHYTHEALGDMLFSHGAFGVDLFFIISGFIICYATERQEQRPLLAYTLKRFFRIYPLLILCLLVFYFLFGDNNKPVLQSMIPLHADYSEKGPFFGYNMLSPVWTITYEICFYAVFLIGLSLSQQYRKYITAALLLFAFLSLQLLLNQKISLSAYTNYDYIELPIIEPLMALLSSPMIIEFIYGIVLFVAFKKLPPLSEKASRWLTPLAIGGAITALITLFSGFVDGHGPTQWGLPSLVLIASLLLYERLHGFPNSKSLFFLGNISFSLYLTHMIIIKIIRKYHVDFGLDALPAFSFAVVFSIAAATMVYYLIENKSIAACRQLLYAN